MKYLFLVSIVIALWQCQMTSQEKNKSLLRYELVVDKDTTGIIDYEKIAKANWTTFVISPNCNGKHFKIALDEQIIYDSLLNIPQDILAKGIEMKKKYSAKKIYFQVDNNEIFSINYEHSLSIIFMYYK